MESSQEASSLDEVLDEIESATEDEDQVTIGAILDAVGTRSFGPVILLAGIVTLMPVLGDIPGVPTAMGVLVVLMVGQLLFKREHIWLPGWLLNRSADRQKVQKGVRWMRKPAHFLDRISRPRLDPLVRNEGHYAIAIVCVLVAVLMPAMEFVPFSANGAGLALTIFGLALIARDGLLALIAFVFTGATLGFVAYSLLTP